MTDKKDKVIELPEKLKGNDMAHELLELPQAIDDLHRAMAEQDREIGIKKLKIELEEDKIKKNVFFDEKLTNKEKRDVALKEKVMESVPIIELRSELNELIKKRETNEIQLKYLYNKFTSIKYLVRLLETISQ